MKLVFVFVSLFTFVMCYPDGTHDDHDHHFTHHHHHHNVQNRQHSGHHHNQYNDNSKDAKIIQQDYINAGNGYNFLYQTSDGVSREEKAEFRNPGTKEETLVVHGSYSYVGADGITYTITYIADENGYRPTGQHIPSL